MRERLEADGHDHDAEHDLVQRRVVQVDVHPRSEREHRRYEDEHVEARPGAAVDCQDVVGHDACAEEHGEVVDWEVVSVVGISQVDFNLFFWFIYGTIECYGPSCSGYFSDA